jgi:hypothetical protein
MPTLGLTGYRKAFLAASVVAVIGGCTISALALTAEDAREVKTTCAAKANRLQMLHDASAPLVPAFRSSSYSSASSEMNFEK